MNEVPTALVVSAHGTPDSLDELPAFLARVRRGRPAPAALLAEVGRRYEAIGGRSPLAEITRAQAEAVSLRVGLPARVAMRLWHPLPEQVLRDLHEQGVRRVVSLPLAPYSVHVYHEALVAAARTLPGPMEILCVPAWNEEPGFVRALADAVVAALAAAPKDARTLLVFSAHSLPVRAITAGDPYQRLFEATAHAVARELPVRVAYRMAYQSQGATSDEWLGPDLSEIFRVARAEGFAHVLVAPIGFVADHVEVLYDVDIEARAMASREGLTFSRSETLNASPALADALAALVRRTLGW